MDTKLKRIKKNHDNNQFRRKIRFKRNKRNHNRSLLGLSKAQRRLKHVQSRFHDYKKIKAPNQFSLLENTEGVLDFISKIDRCFENKKKVFIQMEDTYSISYDAIVVLLSKLIQFKAKKIDFNGSFPKDKNAESILKGSGFLEYLYKNFNDEDTYTFDKKIYTHANKNVNSALSSKIIENASVKLWSQPRRCPGLQRVFIELMQNTNNHASNQQKGEKLWWSSIVHDKEKDKICFSFIDYGVGIIDSLRNKKNGKFAKILDKITKIFSPKNNADILKLLLEGKIHELIKEQAYNRGKGLPGIYKAYKNNAISNLIVITNDVYANVDKDDYKEMTNNLTGTFVYWELNKNNKSIIN